MAAASSGFTADAAAVKSSAYEVMSWAVVGWSETNMLKSAWDMTKPCGTPAWTGRDFEVKLLYMHLAVLPLR